MEGIIWLGIFTAALLALDIYCILKIKEYFELKKHGTACYAKITRLEKDSYRGGTFYRPHFEYITEDNVLITQRCESAMNFKYKKYAVGKSIKIYYDNKNPHKYIIDKNSLYVQIALVFLVTLFMSAFAVLFLDVLKSFLG